MGFYQSYGNLQKYQSKNPFVKILLDRFLNDILQMVATIDVKKVLDLGCGEGFVINKLSKFYSYLEITGVDIDTKALDLARNLNPRAKFIECDINNFQCEKKSFELVMLIEVLEHMKKPDEILRIVKNITSKYALISIPHEPLFRISNFLRCKNFFRLGNDPEHLQNWSKGQFLRLLEKNGFKILKTATPFPWVIVLAEVSA